MKVMRGPVVLIIAALGLVSCAKHAPKAAAVVTPVAPKPAAPPPPPAQPLSTPQTRVELPEPQPVVPAALDRESTAQDTPPVVKPPAAPRRPRPEPAATPTPPPATAPPAETPRVAIQEVISPTEVKRLQDQVQGRRREVNQILEQLNKRRPSRGQQVIMNDIRNFMTLSDEAEKRNDIRQADAFAERAQILARDLQNGK
jgi:hypothetical protein